MTGHPAQSGELCRNDPHPVMRAAAAGAWPDRSHAGVARVPVGFVEDVELMRLEALRQACDNSFLHRHTFALPIPACHARYLQVGVPAERIFLAGTASQPSASRRNWGLPDDDRAPKGHDMDLNSPLFDRIRVKPAARAPEKPKAKTPCSHPGCQEEGVFRAPKGRDREGEYFTLLQGPRPRIQRDL